MFCKIFKLHGDQAVTKKSFFNVIQQVTSPSSFQAFAGQGTGGVEREQGAHKSSKDDTGLQ